ncbi:MAG: single-stranded DNA-binding protein [Kiritimatiellia bacterium]
MADLNRVFLMGNLTRDPVLRYTPSGTAVGDISMAVNRRFKTSGGEQREDTCFVSVVAWGRQAETSGEYLRKGSPVLVEGRLQYDEWEKDGQKFNRLRVVASRIQFLSSGRQSQPSAEGAPVQEGPPDEARPTAGEESDDASADDENLPF